MTDVTDDFNRANGPLGSNWVDSPSLTGLSIISNTAGTAAAAWSMAYWNPATNTFVNDQYSQVVLSSNTGSSFAGPVVRHQLGVSSFYYVFRNPGSSNSAYLYRVDAGTFNALVSGSPTTYAAGDTLGLSITGSLLTVTKNGVTNYTFTDATYTSGQPGIAANADTVDNWLGGPITGTPAPVYQMLEMGVMVSRVRTLA